MSDKYILITGGAGYIGSHTNLTFLDNGYKTIVFDSLEKGHRQLVPTDSLFVQGDLRDKVAVRELFEKYKIEAVVHFAAYLDVAESVHNPSKYYENNVIGTFNLLEAMRLNSVSKLVFSSTCATYGIPTNIPIDENTPQKPINPYGVSKLVVEKMLNDYHQAYGLNFISLRYFNAAGADSKLRSGELHDPETHLIPIVLQVAAGVREKVKIFGNKYPTHDGTCVRDYIHVTDLAAAHLLALQKIESVSEVAQFLNLGTGQGYSVKEIISIAEKVTKKKINHVFEEPREGDPSELVADNRNALKFLNWQTKYSDLENIIRTAWNWYLKQQ